ncbi:MAG: DUF4252 domain-containing protein [Alloprevotella sp.]|nr:DUF4252 domain-containing protein [Alloprevotella sp.]
MNFRKTILSLLFILTLIPSVGRAQQALFDKWENQKGITTVYISRNLLRFMPKVDGDLKDFKKIASKIDQISILECEQRSKLAALRTDAQKYYKSGGYEVVMRINESDEKTTIYQRKLKGGKMEYVLFEEESDEINIICVSGTITLDDIKGVIDD